MSTFDEAFCFNSPQFSLLGRHFSVILVLMSRRGSYRVLGHMFTRENTSSSKTMLSLREQEYELRGFQVEGRIYLVFGTLSGAYLFPLPPSNPAPILSHHSCKYRDEHRRLRSMAIMISTLVFLITSENTDTIGMCYLLVGNSSWY